MYNHICLKPFAAPPDHILDAVADNSLNVFAKATDKSVDIEIIGEIGEGMFGEGVAAKDVRKLLQANKGKPVNLIVNSPGGLVYDGLQIYNSLIAHDAPITATVEGLAYSAASFVTMAADTIRMFEASDIGMHRAWGFAMGNKTVMLDTAEWLATTDDHIIDIYASRTAQPRQQIIDWIDGAVDGTLFSAKQAVEVGLADEVIPLKTKEPTEQAAKRHAKRAAAKQKLQRARLRK